MLYLLLVKEEGHEYLSFAIRGVVLNMHDDFKRPDLNL